MWALYFHLSARGTHLVSVASVPAVASILAFAIEVTWPSNRTTSSALGMLSAEGPNRKLTHHQATPFLILTCGVGFVTPRIFTSWSSNSLRCSFPTYPLTAVGPTKIVSNRQRPTVLRSSILRKGKPYLHGQNGSEIDWLRFVKSLRPLR